MAKKIKKLEFRTPYSESVLVGTSEHFYEASMTEPDNSMSIPEIIAKYTRGQGIQVRQHAWSVGEALEDGYEVGDGIDPEGFLLHGLEQQQQQQEQQQQQQQEQQQQQQQEQQQLQEDSTE